MTHLKKYIGVYLLILVVLAIYFDDPDDDIPQIVWWFTLLVVLFKTPPFNWGDRILDQWARLWWWIFTPLRKWMITWPKWLQIVFSLAIIVLFEEYVLAPLGYTMYPWRMDFGW